MLIIPISLKSVGKTNCFVIIYNMVTQSNFTITIEKRIFEFNDCVNNGSRSKGYYERLKNIRIKCEHLTPV